MRLLRVGSIYGILGLILFALLFPFYVMLITSLKSAGEIFTIPPTWLPKAPTLANYVEVWRAIPLARFFVNSLIIALGAAALTLLCAVPGGYAIARYQFPGRAVILYAILVTQMFSPVVVIITLFKVLTAYRLLNTYTALIVTNAAFALAFSLWMLAGFFQAVPREVEEAARIDGCTTAEVILRVLVPLAAPGVATTVIYTFILAWNEFIFGLTFTSSVRMQPLTVGLASFISRFSVDWNYLMAGSLLATLPVIVLFLLVERHLVKGLSAGALK